MIFTIVHFISPDDNSVQLVPSSWVDEPRKLCSWPVGPKAVKAISSLVKSCSLPDKIWIQLPVKVLGSSGKNFFKILSIIFSNDAI